MTVTYKFDPFDANSRKGLVELLDILRQQPEGAFKLVIELGGLAV